MILNAEDTAKKIKGTRANDCSNDFGQSRIYCMQKNNST